MATYERIENMVIGEQSFRGVVGALMVFALVLAPLSVPVLAGLSLGSIYVVFTAITGWEPLYALGRALRPEAVVELPEPEIPAAAHYHVIEEHKKAA